MPETTKQAQLEHISWRATNRRDGRTYYDRMTSDLHREMREARADGATLRELHEASGLSIAQVQRICDLSKDRSE